MWESFVDRDAVIAKLTDQVEQMVEMLGGDIENTVAVFKNGYDFFQAVEDSDPAFETEHFSLDWRRFLDDEALTSNGYTQVRGVQQDGPEAAALVDGDIDGEFDLNDREHRSMVDFSHDDLSEGRIQRAQEKAELKAVELAINADYDYPGWTADAAVVVHDGSGRGTDELNAFHGENDYVRNASSVSGPMMSVNIDEDDDEIVDWLPYMVVTEKLSVDELRDSQIESLRASQDEEFLEEVGIEPAADLASA